MCVCVCVCVQNKRQIFILSKLTWWVSRNRPRGETDTTHARGLACYLICRTSCPFSRLDFSRNHKFVHADVCLSIGFSRNLKFVYSHVHSWVLVCQLSTFWGVSK